MAEKRIEWEWKPTSVGEGAGDCEFQEPGKLKDFLKYRREEIKLAIYGGKDEQGWGYVLDLVREDFWRGWRGEARVYGFELEEWTDDGFRVPKYIIAELARFERLMKKTS